HSDTTSIRAPAVSCSRLLALAAKHSEDVNTNANSKHKRHTEDGSGNEGSDAILIGPATGYQGLHLYEPEHDQRSRNRVHQVLRPLPPKPQANGSNRKQG